jgi:hypothetical protein
MSQIQKVFSGQVFIYDTEARTLTILIRKAFTDHSGYGPLEGRGFGINMEALQFAIWKGLTVNVLNEGLKYKVNPNKVLQIARERDRARPKTAIFEKQGVTLYMVRAKDCDGQGYYARSEETL